MNIIAAGAIRFGADNAAIPELAHAQGVGKETQCDRIHVHGQVPVMKFFGMNPQQQGKQAHYHEAVNMVGIAVSQDESHGLPETIHLSIPVPIKLGQVNWWSK